MSKVSRMRAKLITMMTMVCILLLATTAVAARVAVAAQATGAQRAPSSGVTQDIFIPLAVVIVSLNVTALLAFFLGGLVNRLKEVEKDVASAKHELKLLRNELGNGPTN